MIDKLSNQTKQVPLDQIHIGPNPTPRHTDQSVRELADSIKEKGMLQPIAVRPTDNGYVQIYGEGRLRALKLLANEGIITADQTIEVVIKEVSEQEAYILALAENDLRNEVPPLMRAESYQKLVDSGMSVDVIAKRLGKRLSFVSEHLALAGLSAKAKEFLHKGDISLERAMLLTKIDLPQQESVLDQFGPNFDVAVVKGILKNSHFLTKYAIFDKNLLAYQPALDPDAEFFLDKEQAVKLQLETLAQIKEQKEGYAFVEVCPGDRFLQHYYKSQGDGLVLVYNPTTYQVLEVPASRKAPVVPVNKVEIANPQNQDQGDQDDQNEYQDEYQDDQEGQDEDLNQEPSSRANPSAANPSKIFTPRNHPSQSSANPSPASASANLSPASANQPSKRPLSLAGYDTVQQLRSKRLQEAIVQHPEALAWAMRLLVAAFWGYRPLKITKGLSAETTSGQKSIDYWRNPQSSEVLSKGLTPSGSTPNILNWVKDLPQEDLERFFIHAVVGQLVSERNTPGIKGHNDFEALWEMFNPTLVEADFELLYDYMTAEAANQTLQSLKPNQNTLTKKEAISHIKISKKPQGWMPPFLEN